MASRCEQADACSPVSQQAPAHIFAEERKHSSSAAGPVSSSYMHCRPLQDVCWFGRQANWTGKGPPHPGRVSQASKSSFLLPAVLPCQARYDARSSRQCVRQLATHRLRVLLTLSR